MVHTSFSECMGLLLSTLDISTNRLSKAINVDCSLVNRWVRGERIPSYHSTYIENISEYLSQNVLNSLQRQHIQELFTSVCNSLEAEGNLQEVIRKILLEAQGYSLERKKLMKREAKTLAYKSNQISKVINPPDSRSNCEGRRGQECNNTAKAAPTPPIGLSCEDQIIIGNENVSSAALSLLSSTTRKKCSRKNTIYLSVNNDTPLIQSTEDYAELKKILLKALKNGWNILLLLRLDYNLKRIIPLIYFALSLIETGRFYPYYLKEYDVFSSGKETILVPGEGILSCYPTRPGSGIDYALYIKNKVAVEVMSNYFNTLLATSAKPLANYFTCDKSMEYMRSLTLNEECSGTRFLYKNEFGMLLLPLDLYKKLLLKMKLAPGEMQKILELHERRLNAFHANLRTFEHLDICRADSIDRLVQTRQMTFYHYSGTETLKLDAQDVIDYLQHVIQLLETYDTYKLAFMHDDLETDDKNADTYFVIKEHKAVILRTFTPGSGLPEVRLSIQEPIMVKAFEKYFVNIWESTAPVNRDKKEIIRWLQSKVGFLIRELDA